MDFAPSARSEQLRNDLLAFDRDVVRPAEAVYREQRAASGDPHFPPPIMEDLKAEARRRELWNLFLPDDDHGPGLSNVDYAPLCEVMGRSPLLSEATNCAAPDTGNMEILAQFGTDEQRSEWLEPLLAGEIRSCFAMTEPWVASSDAMNISSRIERDGDHYVINGHKWFTSGALDPRCKLAIFMGVTGPDADPYRRQSMILVPMDAPGVTVVRGLPVFGHSEGGGHAETLWENVRVPATNLLGEEGSGFAIAQARLGPGRIHHCMRAIGLAEHALALMTMRAQQRVAFGRPLADQGVIRDYIAESRLQIQQARLLTMHAAWMMDTAGKKAARAEIAMIKVVAARVATDVIDRAIQVFGGVGVTDDFPLAAMYAHARTLHLVDGPDEVHLRQIARAELGRFEHLRPAGSTAAR
ncbi:MAG TPA: acyl-CoA dehydrogenase family protein [Acidimicrobiia bacterium]|nr:acyl-CoA dehydrogenase family protein [Acidimicrobiia bacterium]